MSFPDVSNFTPWAENGARQDPGEQKVSLGWVVEAPAYQFYNWWQNRVDSSLIGLMSPLDKWDLQGVAYASEGSTLEGSGSFIYGSPFFETSADNVSGFNSPGSRVFGDEVFLANSGGAQVEGSEHFIFGGGGVQAGGTGHVILNSPGAQISGSNNCVIGVGGPGLPEDFTRVVVLASPAANFNFNPHQQAEDVLIAASTYSSFNGIDARQSVYLASVGVDILGGSSLASVLSGNGSGEINSSTAAVLASSSSSDILDSTQSHIFSSLSSSLEEAYSSYISGSSSSSIVGGTRASIVSSSGCQIERTSYADPVQSSIIASEGSSIDSTYTGAILASSGSDISQGMGHAIVGSGGSEIDGGSHSVILGSSSSDIMGSTHSASLSSIGGHISGGSDQSSLIGTSDSQIARSFNSVVIASEESESTDAYHSAVLGSFQSEVAGTEVLGDMVPVEGSVVVASRGVLNRDPYTLALGYADDGSTSEENITIKLWSQLGDADFAGEVRAKSVIIDGLPVREKFLGTYLSVDDLESLYPTPPVEGAYGVLDGPEGAPSWIVWSEIQEQWMVAEADSAELGTMAYKDAGEGGEEFRNNSQNESKFVTLDTTQSITGRKVYRGPTLSPLTISSYIAGDTGTNRHLQETIHPIDSLSEWPAFNGSSTHILRLHGVNPETSGSMIEAWGIGSTRPDIVVEGRQGVVMGNPDGGFKGTGSINAEEIYVGGVPVRNSEENDSTFVTALPNITALTSLNTEALVDGQQFSVKDGDKIRYFAWSEGDGDFDELPAVTSASNTELSPSPSGWVSAFSGVHLVKQGRMVCMEIGVEVGTLSTSGTVWSALIPEEYRPMVYATGLLHRVNSGASDGSIRIQVSGVGAMRLVQDSSGMETDWYTGQICWIVQ